MLVESKYKLTLNILTTRNVVFGYKFYTGHLGARNLQYSKMDKLMCASNTSKDILHLSICSQYYL